MGQSTQGADQGKSGQYSFWAGQWQVGGGGSFDVQNKFNGQKIATLDLPTRSQVSATVQAAGVAAKANDLSGFEIGQILEKAAQIMEQDRSRLQQLMTAEAGFTVNDANGEILRTVQTLRLSAEEARRLRGEVIPVHGAPGQKGRVAWSVRVPLGVVCAITPFNAPLNTVTHKVAPALAAGNAVILKPSQHTPLIACELVRILLAAGLPSGLISLVHGDPEVVGWLLEEEDVHFYAFTGSTQAGKAIQKQAGLRRTQMELGSIAFAVLCEDADLDYALGKVVSAAYRKAGQVCTSIQMLMVHRSLYQEVCSRLAKEVNALTYGDPSDSKIFVGPVISTQSADRIEQWIAKAIADGAQCLAGGTRQGNVIAPTLLKDLPPLTPLGCQEVFGPVMSVVPFDTTDEVVERINGTPYGLATGIFTNRIDDAFKFAKQLQVGGVHINETSSSRVDMMPYGGSKASGFGREGPYYAMLEMSEERVVSFVPQTQPMHK